MNNKEIEKYAQITNTLSEQNKVYAIEYLNKAKEVVKILNQCILKIKSLNLQKLEKLNDLIKLYDTTSFGFIGFHDDVFTKVDNADENLIIEIKSMDKIINKIIFYNVSNSIKDICSFIHYTNILITKNGRLKVTAKVECLYTGVNYLKLKPQVAFKIMEGGTIIGHGRVIDIIDDNSKNHDNVTKSNNKHLKNLYSRNYIIVRNIINDWDPMNLFNGEDDEMHIDEYDPEIADIMTKLKLATEETLAEDIKNIFIKWFGLENCNLSIEECLMISKKILGSIYPDNIL